MLTNTLEYSSVTKKFLTFAILLILASCGGEKGSGSNLDGVQSADDQENNSPVNVIVEESNDSASQDEASEEAENSSDNQEEEVQEEQEEETTSETTPPIEPPPVIETPPSIADCENSALQEDVVDIKPPAVAADVHSLALDPNRHGTIYMGTDFNGLWKSEDCGASWKELDSNLAIRNSKTWSLAIDPLNSDILYASVGYSGVYDALYKSYNAGESWEVIWPPQDQQEYWVGERGIMAYAFANNVTLDPNNNLHLILTFHLKCETAYTLSSLCFAETFDGGLSWKLIEGQAEWSIPAGANYLSNQIHILDSDTWVLTTYGNNIGVQLMEGMETPDNYRATKIPGLDGIHYQGSQSLQSSTSGTWFLPTHDGIARSQSKAANDWQIIPGTGPVTAAIIETENTLYASYCLFPNFCDPKILKSENDGLNWEPINIPFNDLKLGGYLAYDSAHQFLYFSTGNRLLRIKTE